MKAPAREVLVFPRSCIEGYDGFVGWTDARSIIRKVEKRAKWLRRDQAEKSREWVQAIPCAVIRGPENSYCILRRIRNTTANLRARFSLVVGGHVDRPPSRFHESLSSLLLTTLRRELHEEVGLQRTRRARPAGLVIDSSSVGSSRHIAFLYEVEVGTGVATRAPEEFSARSKFSGRLFSARELARFRKNFDAWSLILFQQRIEPSRGTDVGRQRELPRLRDEAV